MLQVDDVVLYAIERGFLASRLSKIIRKHSNIWADKA